MVKQYGELYLDARRALLAKEDADMAGMMARHLLMHVSGKRQEEILANKTMYASEQICRDMEKGVKRLLQDEPLAYVLGEWDFCGCTFTVSEACLIPRPDTEVLVETAIALLPPLPVWWISVREAAVSLWQPLSTVPT